MSSITFAVRASGVCRNVVVAHNQFLQLLTFVSGNVGVCDNDVFGAKTRSICLRRRLVASVYTLLLDHDDDCLKEMPSSCLLQAG